MPKQYYCDKFLEDKSVCGEKDPEKFETGRFSSCRACRVKANNLYVKQKKDEKVKEKFKTIDSDNNIKCLIEDTIVKYPIYNGCTIVQLFTDLQSYSIEELACLSERFRDNADENRKLIHILTEDNKKLNEDVKNLNLILKNLELKFESLNKN